jgi:hypothetical protein
MSDTSPRDPVSAPQMVADALLRSLTGTSAQLRITNTNATSNQSELGMITTAFADICLSPVAMRKVRPGWQASGDVQWELLVSATSVQQMVSSLELASAQALFDLTLMVTVAEKSYLIESYTSNEAFGQAYLYRLLLRETNSQAV